MVWVWHRAWKIQKDELVGLQQPSLQKWGHSGLVKMVGPMNGQVSPLECGKVTFKERENNG